MRDEAARTDYRHWKAGVRAAFREEVGRLMEEKDVADLEDLHRRYVAVGGRMTFSTFERHAKAWSAVIHDGFFRHLVGALGASREEGQRLLHARMWG